MRGPPRDTEDDKGDLPSRLVPLSRDLSKLLRYHAHEYLEVVENSWVSVAELLKLPGFEIWTKQDILLVEQESYSKQQKRFEVRGEGAKLQIRAIHKCQLPAPFSRGRSGLPFFSQPCGERLPQQPLWRGPRPGPDGSRNSRRAPIGGSGPARWSPAPAIASAPAVGSTSGLNGRSASGKAVAQAGTDPLFSAGGDPWKAGAKPPPQAQPKPPPLLSPDASLPPKAAPKKAAPPLPGVQAPSGGGKAAAPAVPSSSVAAPKAASGSSGNSAAGTAQHFSIADDDDEAPAERAGSLAAEAEAPKAAGTTHVEDPEQAFSATSALLKHWWTRYRSPDGRYWWHCEQGEAHFMEETPGDWEMFRKPDCSQTYWWNAKTNDWFDAPSRP